MPITVKAMSEADYNAWLTGAVDEYAGNPATLPDTVELALAE